MPALGGYLRALREGRHITRTGLASQLDVDPTTLWRIEEGKQEPSGGLLIGLMRALHASVEDMNALFNSKTATAADAEKMAHDRLIAAELRQIEDIVSDPETAETARALLEDPGFYAALSRAAKRHGTRASDELS